MMHPFLRALQALMQEHGVQEIMVTNDEVVVITFTDDSEFKFHSLTPDSLDGYKNDDPDAPAAGL
jgi:hypothetical protein